MTSQSNAVKTGTLTYVIWFITVLTTLILLGTLFVVQDEEEAVDLDISLTNAENLNNRFVDLLAYRTADEYQSMANYFENRMVDSVYKEYFSASVDSIQTRSMKISSITTGLQKSNNGRYVFKNNVLIANNDNLIKVVAIVTVAQGMVSSVKVY